MGCEVGDRIQISREALSDHPDFRVLSPEIQRVSILWAMGIALAEGGGCQEGTWAKG